MYFSGLHFCFGIGNLLGPVFAELILEEKLKNDLNTTNTIGVAAQSNVDLDFQIALIQNLKLTNLQMLHAVIAALLVMAALMFVICSRLPIHEASDSEQNSGLPKTVPNGLDLKSQRKNKVAFIMSMTLLFAFANGINFAYSNFVTLFGVESNLSLTKSQGARTTAIYFGCAAAMRFVSIGLLKFVKPVALLIFDMVVLSVASVGLSVKGQDKTWIFQTGTGLAGTAISTIFPVGVAWAQSKCRRVTHVQLEFRAQI